MIRREAGWLINRYVRPMASDPLLQDASGVSVSKSFLPSRPPSDVAYILRSSVAAASHVTGFADPKHYSRCQLGLDEGSRAYQGRFQSCSQDGNLITHIVPERRGASISTCLEK